MLPTSTHQSMAAYLSVQRTALANNHLNPRKTFENFVVSAINQAAYDVAQVIASQSKPIYNPVYIHGTVGLGKTHLLHAIGHRLCRFHTGVFYRTSEDFLNGFVEAFKRSELSAFRDKLSNIDVLLLDDVQMFVEKRSTQVELKRALDYLTNMEKQVVLTSTHSPSDLKGIDSSLLDRLRAGLVVKIDPPDTGFKLDFIRHRSAALNFNIPEDISLHLSQACSTPREIEGALKTLFARYSITKIMPTLTDVSKWFELPEQNSQNTFAAILHKVATHFETTPKSLTSKSNTQSIVLPRNIVMFLARRHTDMSLPEIGRQFNKHHTTVIHSINKIISQRSLEPKLDELLCRMEAGLPPVQRPT